MAIQIDETTDSIESAESGSNSFRFFEVDQNGNPNANVSGSFEVKKDTIFKYPLNIGGSASEQLHSVVFYINTRENTRAAIRSPSRTSTYGDTSATKLRRPNEEGVKIAQAAANGFIYFGTYLGISKAAKSLGVPDAAAMVAGLAGAGGLYLNNDNEGSMVDSIGRNFNRVKVQQAIELFISGPPSAEYTADWENKSLGVLGGALSTGRVSFGDIIRGEGEGDFDIPGTEKSINLSQFASLGKSGLRGTIQAAAQLPGKLGVAGDLGAAFDLLSGNTLNPYKEQLFTSMGFRKFGFQYKFMPKNQPEMNQVMNIIQLFKYHMHPERDETNYTLIYPSEFEIEYRYRGKRNEYLSKIAPCALTDVKVSYGGQDSFTTFKESNGAPVEINMSLAFAELEMLTRRGIGDVPGTGVSDDWRNTF